MNKIYKIVWNAAQEAWVAVSELAKGHVKPLLQAKMLSKVRWWRKKEVPLLHCIA